MGPTFKDETSLQRNLALSPGLSVPSSWPAGFLPHRISHLGPERHRWSTSFLQRTVGDTEAHGREQGTGGPWGKSGHASTTVLSSWPRAEAPLGIQGAGRSPQHEVVAVDLWPVPGLPQVTGVPHHGTAPAAHRPLLQQGVHVPGHHLEQLPDGIVQVIGLLLPLEPLWAEDRRRKVSPAALPVAGAT